VGTFFAPDRFVTKYVGNISMESVQEAHNVIENDRSPSRLIEQHLMSSTPSDKNITEASDDPIGAALRKIHDAVLDEPLPDDFLDLLDQIDKKIAASEDRK
jgi:Anti-sigma factor NepR